MRNTVLMLLCFLVVASPAFALGRAGVELSANNQSFDDLSAIDPRGINLDELRADTSQDINAWVELELGRFDLGGDLHLLRPELGDFTDIDRYWLATAYIGTDIVNTESFDVYTRLTVRDSAADVDGLEEIFGTVSLAVGTEIRF